MNAIDYVKQNGIEKAKIHLEKMKAERWINSFFNDLKQIVDAFELVEAWGGIDRAKDRIEWAIVNKNYYAADMMKHSINLVEQCQND